MAIAEPNWPTYADKVYDWIQEAFECVYNYQEEMSDDRSKAGIAASYCLLAAHDYLEIAFFAFHKKLYHPGMACPAAPSNGHEECLLADLSIGAIITRKVKGGRRRESIQAIPDGI